MHMPFLNSTDLHWMSSSHIMLHSWGRQGGNEIQYSIFWLRTFCLWLGLSNKRSCYYYRMWVLYLYYSELFWKISPKYYMTIGISKKYLLNVTSCKMWYVQNKSFDNQNQQIVSYDIFQMERGWTYLKVRALCWSIVCVVRSLGVREIFHLTRLDSTIWNIGSNNLITVCLSCLLSFYF